VVQGPPGIFFGTQFGEAQKKPFEHSESAVQPVRHAVPAELQEKPPAQVMAVGDAQVPAPLQVEDEVSLLPMQLGAPQTTPDAAAFSVQPESGSQP
jgi:hypothetical protein